ncbi:MAG: tRNA (adenosine(37)-N6)-threonylcarbamoyltransferase complex ATPase subunit type 1 TsaE [Patescibacteria group bacterium]
MKWHKLLNLRATRTFAIKIGKQVLNAEQRRTHATVVALEGELGSGKTVFTSALASVFHVKRRMLSPTFLIARSYSIPRFRKSVPYRRLFHIDLYRIKSKRELGVIGFNEILKNPDHLVVIEWADRVPGMLPKDTLRIRFRHGKRVSERAVAVGKRRW